ncbi:MAG: class I SAM-dependent methyltransferase [Alphaproteobacteria bacterium]|nr:class I SAM-dependent methyltransferase [Alphaproteobacteria bacterium]
MPSQLEDRIAAHYRKPKLLDAIVEGLEQLGIDPYAPALEDLAPVDEFHTAGRITTLKALAMTPIEAGMHVLDAGCGIGGTARCLAKERGCRVTGIDLTPDYIDVAQALTERTGLSDACGFHHGSVLDMPFADRSFDAAVSFHVAMNIEDRAQFYGELARVLRAGASFCMFDVMKGLEAGMHYPVPWAESETNSFLKTPDETCDLVRQAGFDIVAMTSLRQFAIDFFRAAFAKVAKLDGPPPLGLHLLTGTNASDKFANYAKALNEHRIDPVIIVAKRI